MNWLDINVLLMPDYFEYLLTVTLPLVIVRRHDTLCSLTEFSINVGKFSERNIFRIVLLTVDYRQLSTFIILSQT